MVFSFTLLPTELALEIIRVASVPSYEDPTAPRPSYATAVSLASVSHAMRSATMPHLLHSVVLASSHHVLSFIDSILLQRQLSDSSSALALDYPRLVRGFWSTECWEPLIEDSPDYFIHYAALYSVIRGVDVLGLNFRSLHLLYNGLASAGADPAVDWTCTHVTFAGSLPRWKPLTSSSEGTIFLSRVTHLTLWIPTYKHPWLAPPSDESQVPPSVALVPFALLSNLTHLAFPLSSKHTPTHDPTTIQVQVPTETLTYVAPNPSSTEFAPSVFREWALSDDPLSHGVVTPFRTPPPCNRDEPAWEFSFMSGECQATWAAVDRLKGNSDCDMAEE
ncbi:hypothetical protein C8R46DRAFT_1023916 [Mycena filopes]|nr:hypothetical protein C8R46DRAFT_1023916 [Mycena filopes]